MVISVKLSNDLVSEAKIMSRALNRSVAGQIEYWAKIGKMVKANPDLTYDFIKRLLIAKRGSQDDNLEQYKMNKE